MIIKKVLSANSEYCACTLYPLYPVDPVNPVKYLHPKPVNEEIAQDATQLKVTL